MHDFLLVAGVFVLSLALRSTYSRILQKLSVIGFLSTSYLMGWLFTDSHVVGAMFASFWLVWPWYELITQLRKMDMPVDRTLRHKAPPHREFFPMLEELTSEIEGEGFEHCEDLGRDWDHVQQFLRVFQKTEERTEVAICLMEQDNFAFYFVRLTSRGADGTLWTTWNYPFALNLKLAPEVRMNRESSDRTFLQLLDSHRAFLESNGVGAGQLAPCDAEGLVPQLHAEQQAQISHNLTSGILHKAPDGAIRYTWRGLLFVWLQLLRDFVRLS